MRLSEMYLEGFGIDPKKVRPAAVLSIIDGILTTCDVQESINNTTKLTDLKYKGEAGAISSLSSDLVFIKLLDKPKVTQLYLKLYVGIHTDSTEVKISREELETCVGKFSSVNSFYRALSGAVATLNETLTNCVVIYYQYDKIASFSIIKGSTPGELMNSLAQSGIQSPNTIDKVQEVIAMRGLDVA